MDATQFFDDFLAADEKRQIGLALAQAKRDLTASKEKQCGRCYWWMKSNDCPQERNVNGWNKGPSGGSLLARSCSKFQRNSSADEITQGIEEKIAKIAVAKCFSDLPPNSHY